MKLAKYIDQTALKNTLSTAELIKFCEGNKSFGFKSICIPPFMVRDAKKILQGTFTEVCTVIGFPLGYNTPESKGFEAKDAITNGATEIDMVININQLKAQNFSAMRTDIESVTQVCRDNNVISKVIVETCLLNREQIIHMCQLVEECKADFIKTSTGFSTHGAEVEIVKLMSKHVSSLQIKASGGIKNKAQAIQMIEAGATRLGTSSGQDIIA